MTDLTEQLKKGELLPDDLYWVKHDGVINILDNLEISLTDVEQVLAPVPSYEQWRAKLEENTKLKELLRIILSKTKICYSMVFQKDIINAELNEALLNKINEVLK